MDYQQTRFHKGRFVSFNLDLAHYRIEKIPEKDQIFP